MFRGLPYGLFSSVFLRYFPLNIAEEYFSTHFDFLWTAKVSIIDRKILFAKFEVSANSDYQTQLYFLLAHISVKNS